MLVKHGDHVTSTLLYYWLTIRTKMMDADRHIEWFIHNFNMAFKENSFILHLPTNFSRKIRFGYIKIVINMTFKHNPYFYVSLYKGSRLWKCDILNTVSHHVLWTHFHSLVFPIYRYHNFCLHLPFRHAADWLCECLYSVPLEHLLFPSNTLLKHIQLKALTPLVVLDQYVCFCVCELFVPVELIHIILCMLGCFNLLFSSPKIACNDNML